MSTRLNRLVLPLARDVKAGKPMGFKHRSAAEQILFLLRKPPRRGTKPAAARKAAKATAHRESTGAIREAVFMRAHGNCERPRCAGDADEMDHWLHGIGRRRQKQSVQTCWALCRDCHVERTTNYPSAAEWNNLFREHCVKHGYSFTPHIVHASLRPAPAAALNPPQEHSGAGQEGPEARAERPQERKSP